jgi:hypothetical protein
MLLANARSLGMATSQKDQFSTAPANPPKTGAGFPEIRKLFFRIFPSDSATWQPGSPLKLLIECAGLCAVAHEHALTCW